LLVKKPHSNPRFLRATCAQPSTLKINSRCKVCAAAPTFAA
jgi:hypothetical protein